MSVLSTYVIIDAARAEEKISTGRELNTEYDSLEASFDSQTPDIDAPYIFNFYCPSAFAEWYINEGYGKAWGIFARSEVSREKLNEHLRKFLIIKTDHNDTYFRLYDPRVLRVFLPTCDEQQLKDFFGPVKMFIAENEDSNYLIQFELECGNLVSRRIPAMEFWNSLVGWQIPKLPDNNGRESDKKNETVTGIENIDYGSPRKWNFLVD